MDTQAETMHAEKTDNSKQALVKVSSSDLVPKGVTIAKLDAAVAEVVRTKAAGAKAFWDLGCKIKVIFDGQLYKARVNDDGNPIYRSWNSFCVAELHMSPTHAISLMDVAAAFTSKEVEEFGPSKLGLILKAPPEAQTRLLIEAGKHQSSKLQVAAAVKDARDKAGLTKRETGRKKMPAGKAPAVKGDRITIASILTDVTVPLFQGDAKELRAKKIADKPIGYRDLVNGVREYFRVAESATGELVLKISTKRYEAPKAAKPEKAAKAPKGDKKPAKAAKKAKKPAVKK